MEPAFEILNSPIKADETRARLKSLAERHRKAGKIGIDFLDRIGVRAEAVVNALPVDAQKNLNLISERILRKAMDGAHGSRNFIAATPAWSNRMIAAMTGAAGGVGGLATTLAELPITTVFLLRAIQDVAGDHGFDPGEEFVRYDTVRVFSSAGPFSYSDEVDNSFASLGCAITGAVLRGAVVRATPRLATALGHKMALQSMPIMGAITGATINFTYMRYYQQMAHIHFGLRRLAIDSDMDHGDLMDEFRIASGTGIRN
ncbi:MAG: EcsC family protein [Roseovarius sp.]|nr:EcsC family protein [Roseovarius sp.]MCY4209390.1 EcsC family protein [Roseovarius sp.]MCY4317160.1 EcsC family protein [Roseovarius sp.]